MASINDLRNTFSSLVGSIAKRVDCLNRPAGPSQILPGPTVESSRGGGSGGLLLCVVGRSNGSQVLRSARHPYASEQHTYCILTLCQADLRTRWDGVNVFSILMVPMSDQLLHYTCTRYRTGIQNLHIGVFHALFFACIAVKTAPPGHE